MAHSADNDNKTRREFLYLTTAAVAGVGVVGTTWNFIDYMNPSADVLAVSTTEVDLAPIKEGQSITVMWRGKPVFIRRRTPEEIKSAEADDKAELRDPQSDEARVKKPEWLIVVGVCTHLGCVPLGQKVTDSRGDFGGWFCPCHGSHYDTSGRIRKGPAPKNLEVPTYSFLSDSKILIG
ncbi:MAG: ubiquinol-cytochrome c reductase iron-sulfur subunit [Alphaproteobacteria bacterium]|nr:MAG: ubiquinol-cytochrome c reductase iron-sulfur subunit [Alphaproteobacteria bacterium]